jgi:hypothetical protein
MTDPFSLIAGTIGIFEALFKVAKYARTVGFNYLKSEMQIQHFHSQVAILQRIVQTAPLVATFHSIPGFEILQNSLYALEKLLEKLGSSSKRTRLRWALHDKDTIAEIQGSLKDIIFSTILDLQLQLV